MKEVRIMIEILKMQTLETWNSRILGHFSPNYY